MEFTFELPVRKPEDYSSIIVDKRDSMVAMIEQPDDVDYIVHVINSHKKLVKALIKFGDHEPGCVKGDACNCGFEQALEGEK